MSKRSRKMRQPDDGRGAVASERRDSRGFSDPAAAENVNAEPRPWRGLLRENAIPLTTVFSLALAVRLVALFFVAQSPFSEVTNIDSAGYEKWAAELSSDGWWPKRHFYQSPLYAYYLASVYKFFGPGTWAPRVIQVVAGGFSAVLLYAIGARLFVRRVGWLAGLGLAIYGPLILEEVTLSKTSLIVFIVLLSFSCALRYAPRPGLRGIALSGLLLGIAVVGVGQWLPAFLVFGIIVGLMPEKVPASKRAISSAVFLGAGLCVLGPMVAWNSYKSGGLMLTSGDSGLNFYTGNNPRSSALPAKPDGIRDIPQFEENDSARAAAIRAGRSLTPAQVSSYWMREGLSFIFRHPGDSLRIFWKKFQIAWNYYEIPDNYHYAFMREYFVPVFRGCLTFGVVGPLSLAGMMFPFWRRRGTLALTVLTLAYLLALILFYVRSRYRIPLTPFLILYAAVTIERLVTWTRTLDWRVIPLGCSLLVAAIFVNRTYCEPPAHGFRQACLTTDIWYDQEWMKIAAWYEGKADIDRQILFLRRATECSAPRGPGQTWFWLGTVEHKKIQALREPNASPAIQEHVAWAETAFRRCLRLRHRVPATHASLIELYATALLEDRIGPAIRDAVSAAAVDRASLLSIARRQANSGNCRGSELVLAEADRDARSLSATSKAILANCQRSVATP